MKSSMQGKGLAAPDPKPSVYMANVTRLSVLIGESDADRSRATAELLKELGVKRVVQASSIEGLLEALTRQAFDVLVCAERLGDRDGVSALQLAREAAPATRTVLMRSDRAGELLPHDVETIDLPLSRLTLQGMLHRTAAPQGGLWCEVPELSLTDILQMYHQARRSITVLLSGPIAGRIWLEDGEVVDAECNREHGLSALSHLLEAESGLVRTEPIQARISRTIAAPFQSVILEAAQKLDERRRDRSSSGHPSRHDAGTRHSGTARDPSGPYPGSDEPTSVSSAVLRTAMPPPLQARSPNPESFLVPDRRARRRQTLITGAGMLAGVLLLAVAAAHLGRRLGTSQGGPAHDTTEQALRDPNVPSSPLAVPLPADRAPAAVEPAPAAVEPVAAGVTPGGDPRAAPGEARSAPDQGSSVPAPSAAPGAVDSSPRAPESFELRITSKPSRATVMEAGEVLGKTPLTVVIGASSVSDGPREFRVRLPGHFPIKISQGASDSDVDAAVVLSPRPVVVDSPDAGLLEPELDPAEAPSGNPRLRRKDLGIRLRR